MWSSVSFRRHADPDKSLFHSACYPMNNDQYSIPGEGSVKGSFLLLGMTRDEFIYASLHPINHDTDDISYMQGEQ